MHSSRIRTVRCSGRLVHMGWECLPLVLGDVHPLGRRPLGRQPPGKHFPGRHPPGRVDTPWAETSSGRHPLGRHPLRQTNPTPMQTPPSGRHPNVDGMTDSCENITFPELLVWIVNIQDSHLEGCIMLAWRLYVLQFQLPPPDVAFGEL